MITVNSNCINPIATWLSSKNTGTGQFHIICPIEKYISTIKNPIDAHKRFLKTGVSLSFNNASPPSLSETVLLFEKPLFFAAPYPASSTAFIISVPSAVPSTPIEFVRRLTEHDVTPGTFDTAISTRALPAAHLIPVTVYCSIFCDTSFIIVFTNYYLNSPI